MTDVDYGTDVSISEDEDGMVRTRYYSKTDDDNLVLNSGVQQVVSARPWSSQQTKPPKSPEKRPTTARSEKPNRLQSGKRVSNSVPSLEKNVKSENPLDFNIPRTITGLVSVHQKRQLDQARESSQKEYDRRLQGSYEALKKEDIKLKSKKPRATSKGRSQSEGSLFQKTSKSNNGHVRQIRNIGSASSSLSLKSSSSSISASKKRTQISKSSIERPISGNPQNSTSSQKMEKDKLVCDAICGTDDHALPLPQIVEHEVNHSLLPKDSTEKGPIVSSPTPSNHSEKLLTFALLKSLRQSIGLILDEQSRIAKKLNQLSATEDERISTVVQAPQSPQPRHLESIENDPLTRLTLRKKSVKALDDAIDLLVNDLIQAELSL